MAGSPDRLSHMSAPCKPVQIISLSSTFYPHLLVKPQTWRVIDALRHEAYKGDLLTNKSVVLDYVTGKCVRNNGFVDQFYLEQHHDPIVEPSVYEAIQDYMNQGLLNNRNTKKRAAWFEEHPEILDRRNKSLIEEEKGEKTA